MRTLFALALVLAAGGCSDRPDSPAATDAPKSSSMRGPDPLVLRIARTGGPARVYTFQSSDSVVWTSPTRVPPLASILGFDQDAGSFAVVDTGGQPRRIDLRLGRVGLASQTKLTNLASADGWAIFGTAADGSIHRLTPTGDWTYKPPSPARVLLPQPDGGLIVVADQNNATTVWRMRPPDNRLVDTVALPRAGRPVRTQVGDRVYFTVDSGLIGVRSNDLTLVPSVRFRSPILRLLPTPSGDRLYTVTDSGRTIAVVDRFEERIVERIELPGIAADLRMDPLGRYLLVRPEGPDSVWLIALATNRINATLPTTWRPDLPAVAPDGSIALVQGANVVLVEGDAGAPTRTVRGGAADRWYFFHWDGFRPRAAGLDEPVSFPSAPTGEGDSIDAGGAFEPPPREPEPDTVITGRPPSLTPPTLPGSAQPATPAQAPATTPVRPVAPVPATQPAPAARGFIVSVATLVSEASARETARSIVVDGRQARVVAAEQAGGPLFRVVLGPYPTRQEAERAGRASGRAFWVFEETP